MINVTPSTPIISLCSFILSLSQVGLAARSKQRDNHKNLAAVDKGVRDHLKKIRNHLRDAKDSFDEIVFIVRTVATRSNNEFLKERFKSGVYLILAEDEIVEYLSSKKSLDQSICHLKTYINGILQLVQKHNPSITLQFVELSDHLEKAVNEILFEEKTYQESFSEMESALDLIGIHIQQSLGNRL